ncbi:hypothetical protein [Paenirhodobacter sp. CAU 1674]|uniref:hypothetical protein n=1 Tax=Paenirhodobacter sp. CAU 1674 TaxID=3032596 RepID=UPI0023DC61DA|nr:hypothetical protein [Paenirhodobacter sp. CAU 1674]MDF2143152.1 hypothetical protein [Paenirhodobacter sp. CAU 1674]
MRISICLFACLLSAQPSYADIVQVPLLEDGSVNVEEALSGFQLAFPIVENGVQSNDFFGKLLGEHFSGEVLRADAIQDFTLIIEAPTLSEHGNFLIAVLATDAICSRSGLRPGMVLWSETKSRNGAAWEVTTSCAAATDWRLSDTPS